MIKRRDREASTSHKRKEYYFPPLDLWMTVDELAQLSKCKITAEGLKGRIANRDKNPLFTTIESCVYSPRMTNGNASAIQRKRREYYTNAATEKLWHEQLDLIKLWPKRIESGIELIMQSKEFT